MNSPNPIMSQAMKTIENSICSSLERFQNERFGTVRIVMRNNNPWFVAKDVADCIEHSNVSKMCELCRDKDKFVVRPSDLTSNDLLDVRNREYTLISESGLYRILGKCNLPKCEPFESWVFDEILPSIRRTGSYSIQPTQPALPQSYLEALKALVAAEEAKEAAQKALEAEKEQHEADNRDFQEGLDIMNAKCAQIATRQLATAMSTASAKSRECKRLTNENEHLKDECGKGQNWRTYSEMKDYWIDRFHHKPDINKLKEFCREIGVKPIKDVRETYRVPGGHIRESVVNRYPIEAWKRYERYEELMKGDD